MASLVEWALFGVVLVGHTLLAAVTTRFFRIRMRTRWGWAIYTALVTPFVLFVSTLIATGPLSIGPSLGDPALALAVMIAVPVALGVTLDLLYVPPPEEYDLPEPDSEPRER